MTNQEQQGDVICVPVKEIPNECEKQKDNVIQHGEATGHAHRLINGEIFIEPKTKVKYLRLVQPSDIVHEEHGPLTLPPGAYRVGIVREKGMFDDLVAPVVD